MVKTGQKGVALLDPVTGLAEDAVRFFDEGLIAALAEPGAQWVAQAEPLSGGETNPLVGAVLSEDGTRVLDLLVAGDRALVGTAALDAAVLPGFREDARMAMRSSETSAAVPSGALRALGLRLAERTDVALPAPLSGFQALYARSLDRLFVAGGKTAAGLPNSRVYMAKPGLPLSELPWDSKLGTVLSVTFEPETESLYVLDEVPSGLARLARLLRVDATSGQSEELLSWPRLGLFDRHFLVADRGGKLLIAATSDRRKRHLLVRLDPRTLAIEAIMPRSGALALPPLVTRDGYQVVTRAAGATGTVAVATPATLETPLEQLFGSLFAKEEQLF